MAVQWRTYPRATATNLFIADVTPNVLGDYSVTASNSSGVATSALAALYMSPSLQSPFTGTTAIRGRDTTLSVGAVGSGTLSYQWYQDGQPVLNATKAALNFPSIQLTNGGLYAVVVSSAYGSATNPPAPVVVKPVGVSLGFYAELTDFYASLTIEGVTDHTYGIEFSTNLANVNAWQLLTNLTLVQPTELWLDTSVKVFGPENNGRNYRVSVSQP